MPILEDLSQDFPIGKVNVGQHTDVARKFKVMSVPTLLIYKNENLVDRLHGFISKEKLLEKLESFK